MKLLKFLWNDLKTDIETVIHIIKCIKDKKPILDPEKKAQFITIMKSITPLSILKESWMWLLVIAFAAACAWVISAKYYQLQCNAFIYDNYILPEMQKRTPELVDYFANMTNYTKF